MKWSKNLPVASDHPWSRFNPTTGYLWTYFSRNSEIVSKLAIAFQLEYFVRLQTEVSRRLTDKRSTIYLARTKMQQVFQYFKHQNRTISLSLEHSYTLWYLIIIISRQFIKCCKWWFGPHHIKGALTFFNDDGQSAMLNPSYQCHIIFPCKGCYQLHPITI